MSQRLRLLLLIAECNPEFVSIPRFGYSLFKALDQRAEVTLVTHARNRPAMERARNTERIVFVGQSAFADRYFEWVWQWTMRGRTNWALLQTLTYPVYAEYDARVYHNMQGAVRGGEYDIVQAYTPVNPRYPYGLVEACERTPFLLGPVNGGLPYPPGFRNVGRAEYGYLRKLNAAAPLLPGYRRTYRGATKILAGSTFTQELIQRTLKIAPARVELVHDTGVDDAAFVPRLVRTDGAIHLLFVGRLVRLKGADMVLDAVARLDKETPNRYALTIVGDGEERGALEQQARALGIADSVRFAGWVSQAETARFYQAADLFCFPSIREFGGAVVLEAMAAGLPCLVANYGGIGEFVTPETGIKLAIGSRAQLVDELVGGIRTLANDAPRRAQMSSAAVARAREFTWDAKAERLLEIYDRVLTAKSGGRREMSTP